MRIVTDKWIIVSLITVLASYYLNMLIPTQGAHATGKILPEDVLDLGTLTY